MTPPTAATPTLSSQVTSAAAANFASSPPSRPSRFLRLASLRSRSHGADNSSPSREASHSFRPAVSRTTSATDAILPQSKRGRSATSNEAQDSTLPVRTEEADLFSAQSVPTGYQPSAGLEPVASPTSGSRRRSATTSALPMPTASSTMTRNVPSRVPDMPSTSASSAAVKPANPDPPSIRLVPFHDSRSTQQSLFFPTISRTLKNANTVLRIGRYSEKDGALEALGDMSNDGPIGFKSKVVSRKHCEFSFSNGSWLVKDVKSSSGTFLNHIRLSQPNNESKPYKVKDGDIIQLGINYKGGEESIYRCVKMRVLCNKSWIQTPNNFNTSAHKQLQQLKKQGTDASRDSATDCTICLMAIGPCQSLFIAPCSHTWHYKCIRPLLDKHGGVSYPHFLCPNCRAIADLEEDIEDSEPREENDTEITADTDDTPNEPEADPVSPLRPSDDEEDQQYTGFSRISSEDEDDDEEYHGPPPNRSEPKVDKPRKATAVTPQSRFNTTPARENSKPMSKSPTSSPSASKTKATPQNSSHQIDMPIRETRTSDFFPAGWQYTTPSRNDRHGLDIGQAPTGEGTRQHPGRIAGFASSGPSDAAVTEGPMTPRNNAGPFVFDGAVNAI